MRANFGGTTGDLGSFFASLAQNQESQAKADAKQAEYDAKQKAAEVKAQQAADDQDAFDQWQHGTLDDQGWLDYISGRVSATTDPTEHEKWIKYQRQYTQDISDKTADYKFKSGAMSMAQYIAYQKTQLATFDPNSQSYRDRALVISGLIDTQNQNDLNSRVSDITSKIGQGKATYKDLLAAYQNGLKTTTNADLKSQIQTQIGKLQEQITQDEAQGALDKIDYEFKSNKISGKSAGSAIRAVANKYFKGDEHKYYTILESAIGFEKYPSTLAAGVPSKAKGHSGGGGGSSKSASTKAAAKAQAASINLDRAYANRGKDITSQYLETGGRGPIIDPLTGKQLPVGPDGKVSTALIHSIQLQTMDHYDHLTQLYNAKGEPKQATQAQKDKTYFIAGSKTEPGAVQLINTVHPAEQAARLTDSMNTALALAAASNDPSEMLRVAADYRDKMLGWANRLTTSTTTINAPGPTDQASVTHTDPKALASLPDKRLVDEVVGTASGLDAILQPGADVQAIIANLPSGTYIDKTTVAKSFKALGSQVEAVNGLQTGQATIIMTAAGPQIVPQTTTAAPNPDGTLGYKSEPDLSKLTDGKGHSLDTKGTKLADGYMQMNGTPMAVKIVTYPYRYDQYKTWVTTKKVSIGGYDIAKGQPVPAGLLFAGVTGSTKEAQDSIAGPAGASVAAYRQQLIDSGAIVQQPVNMGMSVAYIGGFTDTNGDVIPAHAWYNDPKLGQWSATPDILQHLDLNPDGTVTVTENGHPVHVTYKPAVTAGMSRWIFAGSDARDMQAISDQVPPNGEMTVDAIGNIRPAAPEDLAKSYYDPAYNAIKLAQSGFRGNPGLWSDPIVQQAKVDEAKDNSMAQFRAASAQSAEKATFTGQLNPDTGSLSTLAKNLGINIGTNPSGGLSSKPAPATERPSVNLPTITVPELNTGILSAPSAPKPPTAAALIQAPTKTSTFSAPTAPTPPVVKAPVSLGGGALTTGLPQTNTPNVQATGSLPASKAATTTVAPKSGRNKQA